MADMDPDPEITRMMKPLSETFAKAYAHHYNATLQTEESAKDVPSIQKPLAELTEKLDETEE